MRQAILFLILLILLPVSVVLQDLLPGIPPSQERILLLPVVFCFGMLALPLIPALFFALALLGSFSDGGSFMGSSSGLGSGFLRAGVRVRARLGSDLARRGVTAAFSWICASSVAFSWICAGACAVAKLIAASCVVVTRGAAGGGGGPTDELLEATTGTRSFGTMCRWMPGGWCGWSGMM